MADKFANFMVKIFCPIRQKEVWGNHTKKSTIRCVACGAEHPKLSPSGILTMKVEEPKKAKKKFKKGRTQK